MKFRKCWISYLIFFTLIGFGLPTFGYAQDTQCGNGMIQRLKIGDIGRVPLDEPTPSTLRDHAGGQEIGHIQPGETFVVIGGPECTPSTGTSWWNVEKSDLSEGWVSEGKDGDYWIEPFTPELFLKSNHNQCKDTPPPRLKVGNFARILNAEKLQQSESFETQIQLYTLPEQWLNPINPPLPLQFDEELLTVEGPLCFNGEYMWRFQVPSPTNNDVHLRNLWLNEAEGAAYILEPSTHAQTSAIPYVPTTSSLALEQSAPIVDSLHQVAVAMSGGDPGCALDAGNWIVYYASYSNTQCIEIVFFPNSPVEARFYEPDGTLYSDQEVITSSQDEYGFSPTVGTYRFSVPNDLDLTAGVWKVDFLYGNIIIGSIAYELKTYPEPSMEMGCDGLKPVVKLTGLKSLEPIELALTASNWGEEIKRENGYQYFASYEVYRWQIVVGSKGELVAYIDFPLRLDNEDTNLYFQIANTDLQVDAYPPSCADATSKTPDSINVLTYEDVATGFLDSDSPEIYFIFTGKKGDQVDINAISFIATQLDLLLQLESPDGTLLTENDDAINPVWGSSDAEIANFILPEDGDFKIVVARATSSGAGSFTLTLNHQQ